MNFAMVYVVRTTVASNTIIISRLINQILGSIVVSIPACHAGDRGSIPRRGAVTFFCFF